ncbi:two-component system, NarL family, sensor histidine kinase EvgS [Methylocystis bryophila]
MGASAGGVTALQAFFSQIGDDLGLAYVVIVHLAPDQPSALAEILATRTSMPVHTVQDSTKLKANCVYVIPPDRELVIKGDDLTARPFSEPRGRRTPIDMFFRSIALAKGDGVAVVLSGSGSDGAVGVRAIKEAGGVIFVQDPNEAEYMMMPQSAIATGVVDFVAPISRLVGQIADVMRSKEAMRGVGEEEAERELRQIVNYLRQRTGHDFSSYKRATILRRVSRRMQVTRQESLNAYYQFLHANADEAKELFSDLLISVTSFFRDRAAYAALAEKVVAPIFDQLQGDAPIRIWVVGCATGEEAYSVGMLFLEEAAKRAVHPTLQIFASDLDEAALAVAREGRYPKAIETDMSEERLKRFFVEEGGGYRVKKELRDLVLFSLHSALKDPPFIKLDLISCRNFLIYLQHDLQRQLCSLFHYALKPTGSLFLGSAETVESITSHYRVVDRDARIYAPLAQTEKVAPMLPQLSTDHRPRELGPRHYVLPEAVIAVGHAHATALEQHAPPNVLIDSSQRILHLSPNVSLYFRPMGGPFSSDLTAQVRPELRVDLKLALQRLFESGQPTLTAPIAVDFNGDRRLVSMHVAPSAPAEPGAQGNALVLFIEAGKTPENGEAPQDDDINREEVVRLRKELSIAQDRVSASRKEHELATQELRAANEELQSINEEYRSTAEELETSKEELQSMNEELGTVNTELKNKLEIISRAHNDLQNLMAATEIGTLFLDNDLKIRLFTPIVANYFNITPGDIGRRISDYTNLLEYSELESDVATVLKTLTPIEREIASKNRRWLMIGLRPYRTLEARIEGVVLTLTDITSRKTAEAELHMELEATRQLQQLSTKFIQSEDITQPLNDVLKTAIELVGADFGAIHLYDDASQNLRIAAHKGFSERFLGRLASAESSDASHYGRVLKTLQQIMITDVERDPAGAPILEEARAAGFRAELSTPLVGAPGKIVGVLSMQFREPHELSRRDSRLIDIVARNAADAINAYQLKQKLREDDRRKNEFLAVLAHELRNPLATTSNAIQTLTRLKLDVPEAQELLAMAARQIEQLTRLVNDLLDISRITQGRIELRPQLLDLNNVVRRAMEANESAINDKRHKLNVSLFSKPLRVYGDPVRLAQALGNLISNAAKYTPEGGQIDIASGEKDGSAFVSVRDNGVGVPQNMLSQIFELFVQAEQAPHAKLTGGLGVGLALARSLVALHGGTIEAFSDGPGKGFTVVIRLPLSTADSPAQGTTVKQEPVLSAFAKRVFVVDDNADVANALVLLLRSFGAEARAAYSGAEALAKVKEFKPDIAFIDLGMPGMDGYEVARALRATPEGKEAILVALSGWGGDEHRKRGLEAGFDRHIIKPIDANELADLLAAPGKPKA